MRCSLTSRHYAYLEATWAANDIQQAVDQNWSYQSTEELTIRTMQIAQIVRIARLNSLTNRIVLPMARLLWVFWRIRMCIFRARVRHTGPTDFLAWWIGQFRVPETLTRSCITQLFTARSRSATHFAYSFIAALSAVGCFAKYWSTNQQRFTVLMTGLLG